MTRTLLLLAALLSGCSTMNESECRSADWHEIGVRDGLFGMQRMDTAYAHQCGKQGHQADVVAYATGWQDGHWEYEKRALTNSPD